MHANEIFELPPKGSDDNYDVLILIYQPCIHPAHIISVLQMISKPASSAVVQIKKSSWFVYVS